MTYKCEPPEGTPAGGVWMWLNIIQTTQGVEIMLSRRSGKLGSNAAITIVRRLARLGVGLLVALSVFAAVPAAQGAVLPAAQSASGLKVQDRSHDNDNPDNTLYALYQAVNTGTAAVPLSSLTMRYWFTNELPRTHWYSSVTMPR